MVSGFGSKRVEAGAMEKNRRPSAKAVHAPRESVAIMHTAMHENKAVLMMKRPRSSCTRVMPRTSGSGALFLARSDEIMAVSDDKLMEASVNAMKTPKRRKSPRWFGLTKGHRALSVWKTESGSKVQKRRPLS